MRLVKETVVTAIWLITFLVFSPLQTIHGLWCKFVLGQNTTLAFNLIQEAWASVLATKDEALKAFFPDAQAIDAETVILTGEQKTQIEENANLIFDDSLDQQFHFFVGKKNGEVLGYAALDTVRGKWGVIQYMLALSPQGEILDTMVLEYREKRGQPVAEPRFLKQFKGKTIQDKIKLQKDIRGVTGASISSRGMTNGIRKMVYVFNAHYVSH